MLIILLVLLLLSLTLFCYTNPNNKENLDNDLQLSKDPLLLATNNAANIASLASQVNGFTDIKKQSLQSQTDIKTLNTQINNLAPLRKHSLQNTANISLLTKEVNTLNSLKQQVADLKVKVNVNTNALIKIGEQVQSFARNN